jgi:hypothetical protein
LAQGEFTLLEHCKFLTVAIKITTPKGVVIFMSFVAEKDAPRKALRPNGFKLLCDLYFCFSPLFLGYFRPPY